MSLLRPTHLLRALLIAAAGLAAAGCQNGRDAYAVTGSGSLISFQTDDPGSIDREVAITGLASGESLLQIDFRPENEVLYGLTSSNRIVTVDPVSGVATLVSATPFTSEVLMQPVMDFNSANDFIRVLDYDATGGSGSAILRVDPDDGSLIQTDGNGTIRFTDNDANDGEIPQIAAIAHSNPDRDATTTTQYGLDFTTQSLVRITNAGVLSTIGVLDRGFVASAGFDIVRERGDQPEDLGTAYVAIAERNSSARLYEINLGSGNTSGVANGTNGSEIGNNLQIRSLAVSPKLPKRNGFIN